MKCYRATARALVEREFNLGFAQVEDDSRKKCYRATALCKSARNFYWALLSKKGAVR